jgi:hypothetical protein
MPHCTSEEVNEAAIILTTALVDPNLKVTNKITADVCSIFRTAAINGHIPIMVAIITHSHNLLEMADLVMAAEQGFEQHSTDTVDVVLRSPYISKAIIERCLNILLTKAIKKNNIATQTTLMSMISVITTTDLMYLLETALIYGNERTLHKTICFTTIHELQPDHYSSVLCKIIAKGSGRGTITAILDIAPGLTTSHMYTILSCAVEAANLSAVSRILDCQKSLIIPSDTLSLLYWNIPCQLLLANDYESTKITSIEKLLEQRLGDNYFQTALMTTVDKNDQEMTTVLLNRISKITSSYINIALSYAVKLTHLSIVQTFLTHPRIAEISSSDLDQIHCIAKQKREDEIPDSVEIEKLLRQALEKRQSTGILYTTWTSRVVEGATSKTPSPVP